MSYLELRNLQKRYTKDGPLIVDNMNLSVEKGEFIVFLGPSGCGKTTTIRMISGLEDVSGGDIMVEGESILHKKPRERDISMIFQSYAIWPHMTAFENIAYPLKLQKTGRAEIKKRVEAAAQVAGIEMLLKRYPSQLSGGQRQRVAVARAIVVKPKIFLMDEPLSNLDAKLRVSMRSELKRIHLTENSTTIFVTHDQAEAMSLADRIVIMYRGKIEQVGTPMEIYRNSATHFAASFIGTPPANFFETRIEKTGEAYAAVNEHIRYRIPAPVNAALAPREGKTTILGIRPEFIELSFCGEKKPGYLCDAVIDFIEPQGNHSILIAHAGSAEIKIVIPDSTDITVNTRVSLTIKDEQVMFFDPDTGIRI